MNLWVCLKCFERVRGSLDSIIKEASEHMCDVNPPIFEYLAGCHKILNDCAPKNMGLPPPPPPPLPQMVPNQPMPRKAVFSQSNKRVSAVAAIAERNKLLGTEISQAGPAPKMPNMASTPKENRSPALITPKSIKPKRKSDLVLELEARLKRRNRNDDEDGDQKAEK